MSDSVGAQTAKGLEVFGYFFNEAQNYPQNFNYSWQQIQDYINDQSPQFFQLLGKTVLDAGLSSPDAQSKMSQMCDAAVGTLPTHLSEFLKAFGSADISQWGWTDTFKAVVTGVVNAADQVATDVTKTSSAIVSNAGGGLVTLSSWLPYIAVGAIGLFIISETGGFSSLFKAIKAAKP